MRTKANREMHRIFTLLVFVALSVAMSGCGGSSTTTSNNTNAATTPDVNRNAPQTQAQQTPTPDPVQAIYGEWETDNQDARAMSGGSTQFVRWKINPGVKDQNGLYIGKLTDPDRNNLDLANYKIGPQTTMNLEFLPPAPAGSATYDYEVSSDGNTLTLKTGNQPIVLKRGTANRDMLKDAAAISSPPAGSTVPPVWEPTSNTKNVIKTKSNIDFDQARFTNAMPSGEGYGGQMELLLSGSRVGGGTYIITSKNSVTLDIGAGRTPAKYALEQNGDLLKITFGDGTEWVFNRK
ncbi:MAG: hypothetical protein H0U54_08570 [Acidobacteria bacterium]|nr:hypothetical protein [Acidobacteriota bacterium]